MGVHTSTSHSSSAHAAAAPGMLEWVRKPESRANVPAARSPSTRAYPMPELFTLPRERNAFEAAVRPCLPRLYRFCVAMTGSADRADDLFQNAMVKAFLHSADFGGKSDLAGWLCGIARNEHLEARRTEGRRNGLLDRVSAAWANVFGAGPGAASAGPGPETSAILGEESDLLVRCLARLPEEFRAVVVLCDLEDLGYGAAAEVLGIPVGTVKSRHARARAKLRAVYDALAATNTLPVVAQSKEEAT